MTLSSVSNVNNIRELRQKKNLTNVLNKKSDSIESYIQGLGYRNSEFISTVIKSQGLLGFFSDKVVGFIDIELSG